jgi:hypothetical protein
MRTAAALPSVIGGPGSDFIGAGAKREPQADPPNLGTGRQPGELLSQERQLVQDGGAVIAGLVGLAEGEPTLRIIRRGGGAHISLAALTYLITLMAVTVHTGSHNDPESDDNSRPRPNASDNQSHDDSASDG